MLPHLRSSEKLSEAKFEIRNSTRGWTDVDKVDKSTPLSRKDIHSESM